MVRAPAWLPQFWTTVRYSVWAVALAAASASRASRQQRLDELVARPRAAARCSPGGATIVRQLPVARAWASGDLAEAVIGQLAGIVVGADHVEREVLEHPDADAVAGRGLAVGAAEQRGRRPARPRGRTGRGGTRDRRRSRPTSR